MLSTGIDGIELQRIRSALERFGKRFLRRVYTDAEVSFCRGRVPELAARFAAKEATMKALGTGARGLSWREIEILPNRRGQPFLYLHGRAEARARALGIGQWAVSLTHMDDLALATVVALGPGEDQTPPRPTRWDEARPPLIP